MRQAASAKSTAKILVTAQLRKNHKSGPAPRRAFRGRAPKIRNVPPSKNCAPKENNKRDPT